MDLAVLLHMSGVINKHSARFEANVPKEPVSYVKLINGELVTRKCDALVIRLRGKRKNPIYRSQWTIYEYDIEMIIRRISRRDAKFSERVNDIALTPQDVDLIIRRVSYQRIKLQLSSLPAFHEEKT